MMEVTRPKDINHTCLNCEARATVTLRVGPGEKPQHVTGIPFCRLCAGLAASSLKKYVKAFV